MPNLDNVIVEALRAKPYQGVRELARAMGHHPTTMVKHLRALVNQGVVSHHTSGKTKSPYLTGRPLPVVALPPELNVLLLEIKKHGTMTAMEAVQRFPRVSPITTRNRLSQLEKRRLTERLPGRPVRYRAMGGVD